MIENIVTGGNGFIGTYLIKRMPNAVHLPHRELDFHSVPNAKRLFFLSTYGNMAHHADYFEMIRANVYHVIWALEKFRGWFCYMSSSSVLLPVQTPYSRTKRAAEEILQALPELKSCIVRPYSVTGVGEQKEHLIPTLIRSCFEGTLMDFVPSATHDYIDVSDVVDGLIRLAHDQATGIHEFGNGIAVENEEVKLLVEEITGRKAHIRCVKPMRDYDNEDWCCSNRSEYWQPTKSLRQSITEMVETYRHAKVS